MYIIALPNWKNGNATSVQKKTLVILSRSIRLTHHDSFVYSCACIRKKKFDKVLPM